MCRTERGASGYGTVEKDCGNALRSEIQCGGSDFKWQKVDLDTDVKVWKKDGNRERYLAEHALCHFPQPARGLSLFP